MAKKKQKEKRRRLVFEVLIFVGLMLVATVVGVVMWQMSGEKESELVKRGLPNRGLPVMEINLNGVSLEEIDGGSKEVKYPGNELTIYNGGSAVEYRDVELKGRGNLSWLQPKKSYQIKFINNTDLIGLGKMKKWVLISNYLDSTLLRNDIALMLAEMLNVKYNNRGEFVELYVDSEYRGLYYLVQKIDIAKGSVDLRGEDGVLFEIDNLHGVADDEIYTAYLEDKLVLKDIVVDGGEFREDVIEGFLADFNDAEKAVIEGDYEKVAEVLDVESFAKFFIVNEFAVDPDAYSSSFYIYRDDNGTIAAGPVWDFDLAFGSHVWNGSKNENYYSPRESMARRDEVFESGGNSVSLGTSKLIYYLMEMPEFREEVSRIFQEQMSGKKQELMSKIRASVSRLYLAVGEDSDKWGQDDFGKEILKLMQWIDERYDYFEETYGGGEVIEGAV